MLAGKLEKLKEAVWEKDSEDHHWRGRILVYMARMLFALGRDLAAGQLSLRAMSLAFTSLLSLVPVLALTFSVLKGFGAHRQVEGALITLLEPFGERGPELAAGIVDFVQDIRVGVLGAVGLLFLVWTVISLIQKIEDAFNETWRAEQSRNLAERFTEYLSLIFIGPFMIVLAIGMTALASSNDLVATIKDIEPFGTLLFYGSLLAPYVLLVGGFTFIYRFIPNTQVNLLPAMIGGIVSTALWKIIGKIFASFVVTSSNYEAVYSGFAILVVLLIWIYVSWLILLIGSSVAFYVQHPNYLRYRKPPTIFRGRALDRLALGIMTLVARRHLKGKAPWTSNGLALFLGVPIMPLLDLLNLLVQNHLLATTSDTPPRYLPARDISKMSIPEVLAVVRTAGTQRLPNRAEQELGAIDKVIGNIELQLVKEYAGMSIAELATETGQAEKPPRKTGE